MHITFGTGYWKLSPQGIKIFLAIVIFCGIELLYSVTKQYATIYYRILRNFG